MKASEDWFFRSGWRMKAQGPPSSSLDYNHSPLVPIRQYLYRRPFDAPSPSTQISPLSSLQSSSYSTAITTPPRFTTRLLALISKFQFIVRPATQSQSLCSVRLAKGVMAAFAAICARPNGYYRGDRMEPDARRGPSLADRRPRAEPPTTTRTTAQPSRARPMA